MKKSEGGIIIEPGKATSERSCESPIRIIIGECDLAYRRLIRERLQNSEGFRVIGEASDGRKTIAEVARMSPDVLTLDINLPEIGGMDVLHLVRWYCPHTKVIIISKQDNEEIIMQALREGAMGYIVKNGGNELCKAVRAVQGGEVWARRRIITAVLEELAQMADYRLAATGNDPAPGGHWS